MSNYMSQNTYRLAKIKLPRPQRGVTYGDKHPFFNQESHDSLLEYLQQRLNCGKKARDEAIPRMVQVDKTVAGWIQMVDEDKERQTQAEKTGVPILTALNLPIAYVHLDDMMSYFAATFVPTRGMFYQTGKPDETTDATQLVMLMNNHSQYAGYYRQVLLGTYANLKYNLSGFYVPWSKDYGPKIETDSNGQTSLSETIRWEGNRLEALDMYNFMYDTEIHPTKLYCDGEYAAMIKKRSAYWLQKKASKGLFYNCEEAFKAYGNDPQSQYEYYRHPPTEAMLTRGKDGKDSSVNWVNEMRGTSSDNGGSGSGFELATVYIKLNPTEFGLITGPKSEQEARSQFETWRFTILNNKWIIETTFINNMHGWLPFFLGSMNDDSMGTSQKSVAEVLTPLQNTASAFINIHIKASRKNLFGTTYYDPSAFDMSQVPDGEVAVRIPMKPTVAGKDIRTMVYKDSQMLDTRQTMQDVQSVMDLLTQFYPTQAMPSQIASIDRAISSQVAAIAQGVNRRQQKAARLMDEMIFMPARMCMYYNIMQYQTDESEIIDSYTGKQIKLNLASIRNTNLPFIIGQGLKSIDRQTISDSLKSIIFSLIQAPAAGQQFNLPKMLAYWGNMMDIEANMEDFAIQQQPATGQPGVDPAAAAAAASGINPATNPAALTSPIYGKSAI